MASKYAHVNFEKCHPARCDGDGGSCPAVVSCKHKLLEQEDAFESPMLLSVALCVGCADCVRACPLDAIQIERA